MHLAGLVERGDRGRDPVRDRLEPVAHEARQAEGLALHLALVDQVPALVLELDPQELDVELHLLGARRREVRAHGRGARRLGLEHRRGALLGLDWPAAAGVLVALRRVGPGLPLSAAARELDQVAPRALVAPERLLQSPGLDRLLHGLARDADR